jgi:hypothetical protein
VGDEDFFELGGGDLEAGGRSVLVVWFFPSFPRIRLGENSGGMVGFLVGRNMEEIGKEITKKGRKEEGRNERTLCT